MAVAEEGLACADALGAASTAAAVQRFAEEQLAAAGFDLERIACGPGCGTCCAINVAVLPAETELIVDYLEETKTPSELDELREKAAALAVRVGGLSDEDRLFLRASCLFLDAESNCSIHPVRPLLCRSVTSTDPQRCHDALTMVVLGETIPIIAHLQQQELFQQAFLGLSRALERHNLPARSQTLTEAISSLLGGADRETRRPGWRNPYRRYAD